MSNFKAKMHQQFHFRGSSPQTLSAPPGSLVAFKGPTSEWRERGKGKEGEKRERKESVGREKSVKSVKPRDCTAAKLSPPLYGRHASCKPNPGLPNQGRNFTLSIERVQFELRKTRIYLEPIEKFKTNDYSIIMPCNYNKLRLASRCVIISLRGKGTVLPKCTAEKTLRPLASHYTVTTGGSGLNQSGRPRKN